MPELLSDIQRLELIAASAGGGVQGQAVVPFETFQREGVVEVTGQIGISSTSRVSAAIVYDNDDQSSQDWNPPCVCAVVPGVGFTIALRPRVGTFRGSVKVNWSWI